MYCHFRAGRFHQSIDAVSIFKPVTKYSVNVASATQISEILNNAFRAAEEGRSGAAYVNLPIDTMTSPAPMQSIESPRFSGTGSADIEIVKEAAKIIGQAKNPVVLLGMRASKPKNAAALQPFLSQGNLAVVGTFQSAGAVGTDLFQNYGGRVGQINNQPGDRLLDSADLVITIGYDPVEYWPPEWNLDKKRKIIHIDVAPAALELNYQPYVELIGDIALTLNALTPLIKRAGKQALSNLILTDIHNERAKLEMEAAGKNGTPIHPLRIVHALQQFLSSDVTVCLDMGSFHLWIAHYLYSFRPRQILMTNGQQTLGVALPWAIAASLVRPNEKILSISGDGGFLFSAMELETAVRLGTHLVHLVWIDGAYDMVKEQEEIKYGRSSGIDFGPVDYIKYAETFGATGMMIKSPDQILPVLKKAFDTAGPVIIGIHVDYSDNKSLFEQVNGNSFH